MAKNAFQEFIDNIRFEVSFNFAELLANPEAYSDWSEVGDKGVPFSFFNGEIINLPKKNDVRIWGRTTRIGKKHFPMLYTAVHSNRRGWIEVPISIFRRVPSLKEEIEVLSQDNEIGISLIPQMPDIKRIEILSNIVGERKFTVTEVPLHKNGFDPDKNKPILDDPKAEEKDRVSLICYRFNFLQA
jgi:hypothetical protein